MIKKTILHLLFAYKKYFPVERGKTFISNAATQIFGSFLTKTKSGVVLDIFASSAQDSYLFNLKNDSDDIVLREINSLQPGEVFIDIGANIGLFSFLAANRVGTRGSVIAIEPSRREYKRLVNVLPFNYSENILTVNAAISEVGAGSIRLNTNVGHTGMNRISLNEPDTGEKVMCCTVDHIMNYFSIDRADLIKIDVEGAEFFVLKSASESLRAKKIARIVVEITPGFLSLHGHTSEEIYRYMASVGYYPVYNNREWQHDEVFVPEAPAF